MPTRARSALNSSYARDGRKKPELPPASASQASGPRDRQVRHGREGDLVEAAAASPWSPAPAEPPDDAQRRGPCAGTRCQAPGWRSLPRNVRRGCRSPARRAATHRSPHQCRLGSGPAGSRSRKRSASLSTRQRCSLAWRPRKSLTVASATRCRAKLSMVRPTVPSGGDWPGLEGTADGPGDGGTIGLFRGRLALLGSLRGWRA
jgi:hypothetical protein